jgi:hypothetical protein
MNKGKLRLNSDKETDKIYDISDEITSHLTKNCWGNMHDDRVVAATPCPFENTAHGNDSDPKQIPDLENDSSYDSGYRTNPESIPPTRNNWRLSEATKRRPQGAEAPNLSSHFGELITVVGLRAESRAKSFPIPNPGRVDQR